MKKRMARYEKERIVHCRNNLGWSLARIAKVFGISKSGAARVVARSMREQATAGDDLVLSLNRRRIKPFSLSLVRSL